MKRHSPLIPAALVAAFALAACGSDTPNASTSTIGDTIPAAGSGLLAPRPISVTSGGGGGAAPSAAESSSRVSGDMAIMPYYIANYVVGAGMPALPTNDIGYVYQAGATVTAADVAALAATFGLTGEPVRIDDGYGVQWRVGPDDGTGPSLWLYQDAQLSWNYSSAWAVEARSGCAVGSTGEIAPGAAPDAPVASTAEPLGTDVAVAPPDKVPCEEPTPPVGVPTKDAAEQRARDLLVAAGQDPADYRFETYADEWFASVTAVQRLDGAVDGRRWDFGFGAEGVLQYASGQLADAARVGPYPLIGLDAAIARLNDQSGMWGGYAGGGIADGVGVASPAVEGDVAVDVPEGSVTSGGAAVDAMPIGSVPEPEPITVTLVDVQADVWWAWDVDGSIWLLPAYRFIGDDGGWYTVPAVTDEFLIQVQPPAPVPMPEPMPVETAPGAPTPAPDAPPVTTADFVTTDFDDLVGVPLDRFVELAKERGAETRVVIQDGVGLDQTADFSPSRVNVEVTTVDGVQTVTSITGIG